MSPLQRLKFDGKDDKKIEFHEVSSVSQWNSVIQSLVCWACDPYTASKVGYQIHPPPQGIPVFFEQET